jgi:hypothetical protein
MNLRLELWNRAPASETTGTGIGLVLTATIDCDLASIKGIEKTTVMPVLPAFNPVRGTRIPEVEGTVIAMRPALIADTDVKRRI